MTNDIILQGLSVDDLEAMLQKLVRKEFEQMFDELQQAMGEDDLVSTGTACRVLGVCSKVLKVLTDEGHFTVYHHLKERRYIRGELLEYRDRYRSKKKRG
jgi:DNA-binding transcriptional ArsR family regulator